LLVGGAAAAVAVGVDAAIRPHTALAQGTPVYRNEANPTTSLTTISRDAGATTVTIGGFNNALYGQSTVDDGVAVSCAVTGLRTTALRAATQGHSSQIGISADASTGAGEGYALKATTRNGVAVHGEATGTGGYALHVVGQAVFSRSGKAGFGQGQSSKTITSHSITAASLVLATIQGNVQGTYVRGVSLNDAANSFTIRLNKPAPSALKVGWFIVN
jgi:hypothetical protein